MGICTLKNKQCILDKVHTSFGKFSVLFDLLVFWSNFVNLGRSWLLSRVDIYLPIIDNPWRTLVWLQIVIKYRWYLCGKFNSCEWCDSGFLFELKKFISSKKTVFLRQKCLKRAEKTALVVKRANYLRYVCTECHSAYVTTELWY